MNVKSWIVAKLLANTALMTAIGGQSHLLPQHPGTIAAFPCLIYTEANHATTGYFDNVSTAVESIFVMDIYTSGGTTSTIFDALQSVMAGSRRLASPCFTGRVKAQGAIGPCGRQKR